MISERPPAKWLKLLGTEIISREWVEWHLDRGIDPRKRREPISAKLRAAVLERDGYVCQICGADVQPDDVHLDHRVPFARGGLTTLGNLQVAHSRCNRSKRARV